MIRLGSQTAYRAKCYFTRAARITTSPPSGAYSTNLSQAVKKTWLSSKTTTIKEANRRAKYPFAQRTINQCHNRGISKTVTWTIVRPSFHNTSSSCSRWLKPQLSLAAQATCLRTKNWWMQRKSGLRSQGTMEWRLDTKLNPSSSEKQDRRAPQGMLVSLSLSLKSSILNSFLARTSSRLQS